MSELSDVDRYIENNRHITLDDKISDFNLIMGRIRQFKEIDEKSKVFEVGVGIGWFPVLCQKHGIECGGLEISPQLVEYANEFARKNGVTPDITLGNIEESDLGESVYDVVVATSTFEHVERWWNGIRTIFRALRPGGLFYFYSSNKFSIRSGEFNMPFYSWLPDSWRYKLRVSRQGDDIMKLGIDFNQFTHHRLRRVFRSIGFNEVYDRIDVYLKYRTYQSNSAKYKVLATANNIRLFKHLALLFRHPVHLY